MLQGFRSEREIIVIRAVQFFLSLWITVSSSFFGWSLRLCSLGFRRLVRWGLEFCIGFRGFRSGQGSKTLLLEGLEVWAI